MEFRSRFTFTIACCLHNDGHSFPPFSGTWSGPFSTTSQRDRGPRFHKAFQSSEAFVEVPDGHSREFWLGRFSEPMLDECIVGLFIAFYFVRYKSPSKTGMLMPIYYPFYA